MFVTDPKPTKAAPPESVTHPDHFVHRHIGPAAAEVAIMAKACGFDSLDALIDAAVPPGIRLNRALNLPAALSEYDTLTRLRGIAALHEQGRPLASL